MSDDDNGTHVACCMDDNVALCGEDVTGDNWVDDDEPTTCTVCATLEDVPCFAMNGSTTCPIRRT